MKKILFAAAIAAAACTGQVADNQCQVEISMKGTNDTMCLFIVNADQSDYEAKDTIVAKDGKFTYTATIEGARLAYLMSLDQSTNAVTFYLLPGETLKLTGDINSNYHMGGSKAYDEIDEASSLNDDLIAQMRELSQEYEQRLADGESADSLYNYIMPLYSKLGEQIHSRRLEYMEQNPKSLGAVLLLSQLSGEEFEKYDAIVDDAAKNGALAEIYGSAKAKFDDEKARVEAQKALQNGGEAPDFTLPTIDGKELTLSSLRGKYVVLDFWGSWCGWCIKGMPDMKKYYEKYAGKFEIVGIDCNDSDEAWKEAVKKHELPWLHVKNGEGDKDITSAYAIEGFPTKLVIDPEGKVVKYIVGEDPVFYTALDELLGE